MFILMPVIFVLGILAIALEDKIKINKAAIALFMAISLWMILMFDAYDIFVERSSPLFQEFLTQNPEMANAPLKDQFILKSASNLNGNLNCSKELEHYAS